MRLHGWRGSWLVMGFIGRRGGGWGAAQETITSQARCTGMIRVEQLPGRSAWGGYQEGIKSQARHVVDLNPLDDDDCLLGALEKAIEKTMGAACCFVWCAHNNPFPL